MFAWIPIIGPIIQGIVSIFAKAQDTALAKYQTDADVAKTEITASTQTLSVFKDDLGVQLCRDLILFPTSMWLGLFVWDKIVDHRYPWLVFNVSSLPPEIAYLPHMALVFLFGINAMNIWRAFR